MMHRWKVASRAVRVSSPSSIDQLIEQWSKMVWPPPSPMPSKERPASSPTRTRTCRMMMSLEPADVPTG